MSELIYRKKLSALSLENLQQEALDCGVDPSLPSNEIIDLLVDAHKAQAASPEANGPPDKKPRGRSKKTPGVNPELDGKVSVTISTLYGAMADDMISLSVNGSAMLVRQSTKQDLPWPFYLALHNAVTDRYRTSEANGLAIVEGPFPEHTYQHTVVAFGRRPKEYRDIPLIDLLNNSKDGIITDKVRALADFAESSGA